VWHSRPGLCSSAAMPPTFYGHSLIHECNSLPLDCFYMPRKSCFLFVCLFLIQLTAHADSIKDELDHKYKKQIVVLRAPFTPGDQKFDSSGHSMNPPPQGPWMLYGGIYVENVGLSPKTLRLSGYRIELGIDKKKDQLFALGKPVEVEINLDQPLTSFDEAQTVLLRVLKPGASVDDAKPEFRRSDAASDEPIYGKENIKKGDVTAPIPIHTPEPEYSEAARKAKVQGMALLHVVVDKTGNVVRIVLDKGLGYGLGENAMEGLKVWRFKPATRDGHPVYVEMKIEVAFRLRS
jgi:TonB family protein